MFHTPAGVGQANDDKPWSKDVQVGKKLAQHPADPGVELPKGSLRQLRHGGEHLVRREDNSDEKSSCRLESPPDQRRYAARVDKEVLSDEALISSSPRHA